MKRIVLFVSVLLFLGVCTVSGLTPSGGAWAETASTGNGPALPRERGGMNELIAELDIDHAGPADVIRVFGEPDRYAWDGETFGKGDLPHTYLMYYSDNFSIEIFDDTVIEARFADAPLYVYGGQITVGSTSAEVFAALGQPVKTVEGVKTAYAPGVFYKDRGGAKGSHYYKPKGHPLRLFFRDDRVCSLYLTADASHPNTPDTQPGSMDARVAELDIDHSGQADVIRIFGEPQRYAWDGETFAKDALPRTYLMSYSDNFSILMSGDMVIEARFTDAPLYVYGGQITVGSTRAEVLAALGPPEKVIKGVKSSYVPGVFYKDLEGKTGVHYYAPKGHPLRLFFRNDKVCALYLTRSGPGDMPDHGTPDMGPGSMNARVAELDIDNASPADVIRIFGEPEKYGWNDEIFAKDALPRTYLMSYSDYFSVVISRHEVTEARFANAPVYAYGTVTFGSAYDEVFASLGAPTEIVENGSPVTYTPGVFYKDVFGETGSHFYQPLGHPLKLYFRNDRVLALCLIRSEDAAR